MRFAILPLLAVALAVVSNAEELTAAQRREILLSHRAGGKLLSRRGIVADNHLSRRAAVAKAPTTPQFKCLTNKTKKFAVNGSSLPDVPFNVGESYAGLLPISTAPNEPRQLYFWFFPSDATEIKDNVGSDSELLIWLNGGPGCSSLEGLLQENGPFSWQYGTFRPVKNPWSWTKLTNVLWIEQPVGTGFSRGTPNVTSSSDAAAQLLGFLRNWMDTFDYHNKKIYIAGESYAGMYIPYIGDAMLASNAPTYFNLQGTLMYDPVIGEANVQDNIPVAAYVDHWKDLLGLNDTFLAAAKATAARCGYTNYLNKYLTYPPPKGFQPTQSADPAEGCDLWMQIFEATLLVNPCFDMYQIATTCPLLWDQLGFPGSQEYLPDGATVYFDRADVKKAINAPNVPWATCSVGNVFVGDANGADLSLAPIATVLPRVIEKSKRTMIAHGQLDFVLIENGTLLSIQNMTWGGMQGFQKAPVEPLLVPYHPDGPLGSLTGAGVFGTAHTERGLTYSSVKLSGHMVPQYAPSAAYRHVQYLLGRISSLSTF
ncbi:hypothetical protein HDU87_006290 [Geranomyces variabilis]|uniref:Carboxypeptidase n=1 Tax=Geranomyces variabilis TaxID=109894 RepID=A0AAD5TFR6_9FUNG|nr:hypothetical protein HDU87_006290 [Geranomyces variabilis]